jgi:Zn-dependent peptidase ImmA (M78 family)/transcriptional regulator with XRE-family HTH domain
VSERAAITPKVLQWGRESARVSLEDAASKVGVSPEKLEEWESGETQPTIRQAQTLAKAYKRPFALFFLPEIPKDFQPLQDYRRKGSEPLGTASLFIIREIQQKQAWIRDINEDLDERCDFVGRFSTSDAPETVASDILATLQITPGEFGNVSAIRAWVDKAEANGIYISRTSFIHSKLTLDSDEIQGFAIADSYAPFVFINSDDFDAPQLFTLVHELVHIWIAATGISNTAHPDDFDKGGVNYIELYCNEVAAIALIPNAVIYGLPKSSLLSLEALSVVAKRLGVSSLAMLVRLYRAKLISLETYRYLRQQADERYQAFLRREEEKRLERAQKENQGGPNYYLIQVNRNGRLFTQTVLDAYREGSIEPTYASRLLNVHATKFPKLEEQLYR